jgi:phosphoesterase RecJ-like protein
MKNQYQAKIKRLFKIFKEAKSVALFSHKDPDGDALGSSLALRNWFLKDGKKVFSAYAGVANCGLKKLFRGCDDFFVKEGELPAWDGKPVDLIVILDAGQPERTGFPNYFLEQLAGGKEALASKLIIWDHHRDSAAEGVRFSLVLPQKAATCEMVYDFFRINEIDFGKEEAAFILTGIFTDTGGFLHANTTSGLIKAASYLMRKGVSLSAIAKGVYAEKKPGVLKIWGRALARAEINQKTKAAFSYVTQRDLAECQANLEDLSGVTNILGTASESRFSIFLAEAEENKIKGSLRSEENKHCDVSKIARMLGGGGHRLASGFEIKGRITNQGGKAAVA